MNAQQFANELIDLLKAEAKGLGEELKGDEQAVRQFAAERARALQQMLQAREPGFDEVARACADRVVLQLAGRAMDRGKAWDNWAHGAAAAAFNFAARFLAAA